jgi:hypothetical protein
MYNMMLLFILSSCFSILDNMVLIFFMFLVVNSMNIYTNNSLILKTTLIYSMLGKYNPPILCTLVLEGIIYP